MLSTEWKRILVVEGQRRLAEFIRAGLATEIPKANIEVSTDPYEAIELMTTHFYDLVIIDKNFPEMDGIQTLLEADRELDSDPTLPSKFDEEKTRVVTLSYRPKVGPELPITHHFDYLGEVRLGGNKEANAKKSGSKNAFPGDWKGLLKMLAAKNRKSSSRASI